MLLAIIPQVADSQQDTSSLHATILGWSDRTWLYLLDRGVDGGRLNDQGMLISCSIDKLVTIIDGPCAAVARGRSGSRSFQQYQPRSR